MSRFFIDCEFVEDGRTIDLISIGIVSERGNRFYAVSTEFDTSKAQWHGFVSNHVLPLLPQRDPPQDCSPRILMESYAWMSRECIARRLLTFVNEEYDGTAPEFWGDWAAYDWVATCQLFGTMMELPEGWPFFCRDTEQLKYEIQEATGQVVFMPDFHHDLGLPEHSAINDAAVCRARWQYLTNLRETTKTTTSTT